MRFQNISRHGAKYGSQHAFLGMDMMANKGLEFFSGQWILNFRPLLSSGGSAPNELALLVRKLDERRHRVYCSRNSVSPWEDHNSVHNSLSSLYGLESFVTNDNLYWIGRELRLEPEQRIL